MIIGKININIYSLYHLLLYLYLGFFFPNRYLQSIIIGVSWEVLEIILTILLKTTIYYKESLINRIIDIIINIIGYYLGNVLSHLIK